MLTEDLLILISLMDILKNKSRQLTHQERDVVALIFSLYHIACVLVHKIILSMYFKGLGIFIVFTLFYSVGCTSIFYTKRNNLETLQLQGSAYYGLQRLFADRILMN